jgi:hypothetical protein
MSKLLGFFEGPRPFAQMRARALHGSRFGEYEAPGAIENQFSPFEYGQRHLGVGADPPRLTYDLSQPGRVKEVKRALRVLGQAGSIGAIPLISDLIVEKQWTTLQDDDVWTNAAADEFVAFVSRWAPVYVCFGRLYSVPDGSGLNLKYLPPQPSANGLLLLDAAYRYETASLFEQGVAYLKACGYGAASKSHLSLFENFLYANKAPGDDSADLDPSKRTNIDVVPTANVEVQPIPPPDVDATLYTKWQTLGESIVALHDKLAMATTEEDRRAIIDRLETERLNRDAVAKEIIGKAPPRDGGTSVEHPVPYLTAGMAVGAGLLLATGAILVGRARSAAAERAPARRRRRR